MDKLLLATFGFMLAISPVNDSLAADWSDCASDLDSLKSRADDASSAAEEADSKKREYDDALEEYRNCRSMPSVYDLYGDNCRSKRGDAEDAEQSYRNALSDLEGALADVDSQVRSVSSSCEINVDVPSAATSYLNSLPPNLRRKCALYIRYTGRIPKDQLRKVCAQNNSPEDCARCVP
jgi:chromosome segregation ATPase